MHYFRCMQEPQLFTLAIILAYASVIFAILTLKISQFLLVILLLATNLTIFTALLAIIFILQTLRKLYLCLTFPNLYLASDINYVWGEPVDFPAEPEPLWPQAEEEEVKQEVNLKEALAAEAYNWEAHWQPICLATPPNTDSPSSKQAYLDLQESLGECLEMISTKISKTLSTLSTRMKRDLEEYLKT